MNILVINALNGVFAQEARKKYSDASITCLEWFDHYVPWLRRQGFEVKCLDEDLKNWERELGDMKFDLVLSNPPYNINGGKSKNKSGSLGNQTAYNLFIDKGLSCLKVNGEIVIVCPRQGIRNTHRKCNIKFYSLETSKFWNFQCGYFVGTLQKIKSPINVSEDSIIRKCCAIQFDWKYRSNGGKFVEFYDPKKEYIDGIIELPSSSSGIIRGKIRKDLAIYGPKVMSRVLETNASYIATDEPAVCSAANSISFDTLEEAEKCCEFIKKSPLMKYIQAKMNARTKMFSFIWLKKFEMSGDLYPKEFNLTEEEIRYIEEQVK